MTLWVVSAKWMQQLIADINFADYESRMCFDRQLRKSGLFDRLEEMGIEDGDTVSIYDFEFEVRAIIIVGLSNILYSELNRRKPVLVSHGQVVGAARERLAVWHDICYT